MFTAKALKISQKGVGLYVTALPFKELKKHVLVDYWSPSNPNGYQRPLVDRRLADVAKYMMAEQGVLPTSILLCVRSTDEKGVTFKAIGKQDGFAEIGDLTVPEEAKLWIVDGQHRFYGVNRAYEREGAVEFEGYAFPVTILAGVSQYDEMIHFNIINTTQKKMPTDIVDRHLVQKASAEGVKMIASGSKGEKEYMRAKATRIIDLLDQADGPWHNQIAVPGVVGKDQGLVRQHAMVAAIEPALKDAFLAIRSDEEIAKLLNFFWKACQQIWPEAFGSPDEYRVQATVGVYALNWVFPSVVHLCVAERKLSQEKMAELIAGTGIDSKFWSKTDGDSLTLGTGMASIRALAMHIREALPKGPVVEI
jgi:DGQHR domain-containing protein